MAINQDDLKTAWVQQGTKPNCGSCCVASIFNYAIPLSRALRGRQPMHERQYIGLTINGVHNLGSLSAKIFGWFRGTQQRREAFAVRQVRVINRRSHWGGLSNAIAGGDRNRPYVAPGDPTYWLRRERFLLREFSAGVSGHFIIQTGPSAFWNPHCTAQQVPTSRETLARLHPEFHDRSDALEIDVEP